MNGILCQFKEFSHSNSRSLLSRPGLLVFLRVRVGYGDKDACVLARKIANLRIFPDDEGKMNRSLLDVGGETLSVSQFTLYSDVHKGNRPRFTEAAKGLDARRRGSEE